MKTLLPILSLFLCTPALAQNNKLLIAASSSSGTYAKMLGEIIEVCSSDDLSITEVKSVKGGAPGNLAALMNNEVSAAFLHSDVIYAAAAADSAYRQLQTLVSLYPEEVHVVVKRSSGLKKGGTMGIGAKPVEFNTLADLRGYKVGGAGGGAITAKVLQGSGEGGFEVIEKATGDELLGALAGGEVQAAIFVGGAPLEVIKKLDASTYKLIPIPEEIFNRVSSIYKRATINYPGLTTSAIKTVAPSAILLTRKYKSPKMVGPQQKFRACFYQNLDELKETPGKHTKWQLVNENDQGTWTWLELPAVAAAAPTTPEKTKKR